MKRINPIIGAIWASAILVILLVLYTISESGRRKSHLEDCWKLAVTGCEIGKYSGEVEGMIINNCTEKADSVEVVTELYSIRGELLVTGDPIYVENIESGDRKVFKATIYATDSHGAACMAHITQGY